MSRYALKFPRRVRIHGGEFDESARAIHREDGLKTIQAESGIVLDSTIERKQMSTKTTFKRIALVAVAALGFGVMSVAPSSAAPTAVNLYHTVYSANGNCNAAASFACSPVTSDTSWVLVNSPATYGFQTTFLAANAGDAVTHTWTPAGAGALWQYPLITITPWKSTDEYGPAGGSAGGFTGGFDNNSGWGLAGTSAGAPTGAAVTNGTPTTSGLSAITTATAAGGTIGNFKNSFTPTAAGTYVWELKSAQGGPTYTWTIIAYATQAALDTALGKDYVPNAGKTTSILVAGEAATAAADVAVIASKATSDTATATIYVTPKNAADVAITSGQATFPLTVTVAGPGTVAVGTNLAAITALSAGTGRAVTGTTGHYVVGIFADGTSGVSTVTISTGTTVLATETVTFYGAAATITPTVVKGILSGTTQSTGAITAVVKDAAGVVVAGQAVTGTSGTVAAIANAGITCSNTTSAGLTTCDLTGLAAGSSAITLTAGAAVATTTPIRVSNGIATLVSYTFDKATYAPGETAKITATVSNAAGVMPAGTYTVLTGALTSNYALGSLPATTPATVVAVGDTGQASYTVTMSTGISGTVQLAGTQATAVVATFGAADVVNEALDAALEAIDAAENARQASEAAIEAATDAQAAAEDAEAAAVQAGLDAVAAAEAAGVAVEAAIAEAIAATEEASAAAVAAAETAGADAIAAAEQAGLDAVSASEMAVAAADAATAAADLAAEAATEAGEMAVAAAEAAGLIAQDALDAAIEATQAATDALDAANEAKASADAATAAATAAVAAVEALSTKVQSLIAGMNAKINSLSTLLGKIAKKVGVKK